MSDAAHRATKLTPDDIDFIAGVVDIVPLAVFNDMITFDVGKMLEFVTVIEPPEVQTNVPLLAEGNATAPPSVSAAVPDCAVVPIVTPPVF